MIVHTLQIGPDGLHLEGEQNAAPFGFPEAGFEPVSPVRYSLDVGLSGGGVFATGRIAVTLQTECVGCLKRFSFDLELPDVALQTDLTASESVDLTPMVREDIFLALPAHPRCDSDGRSKCPGPGEYGGESAPETGPSPSSHVWDALEQLKTQP